MKLQDNPCYIELDNYPIDFSPCHRRVLSGRQIDTATLKKPLTDLYSVSQLSQAKSAAIRLYDAIQAGQQIVLVGDYDADGATSTALVLSVLQPLGAKVVSFIPNRFEMGYGLSQAVVDAVLPLTPDIVMTVDNGITANAAVDSLKQHGVAVIITDHHLPTHCLPDADVIVNPNQPSCDFPSKCLAGVGVAFYVMLALRQIYRERGDARIDAVDYSALLALVAIGTIADVVELDYNNRILVEHGLKQLRHNRASIGINALLEVSGCDKKTLSVEEIAFQIAPRLNAAGRVADMQLGVDCLLAKTPMLAKDYALELDRLNRERKAIENEMKAQAQVWIEQIPTANQPVICLCDETWHEGVIGILAGRLKSRYQKTVFVFTQNNGLLKGSARAAEGVNLVQALNAMASDYPEMIRHYGGHAKAAGLSLLPAHFVQFSTLINPIIDAQLTANPPKQVVLTDGELLPYEMNVDNAIFLKTLEVWGNGMPMPRFRNTFFIDAIRGVGDNHAQLSLIEQQSGRHFKGIAFDKFKDYYKFRQNTHQIAYQLNVNHWQGKHQLSLQVIHIEE
ncbi:single-stranded-DNA-specific exonuclease RecJ [Ostreibacterium oceani]|uniref:Single-stranded-DNA-specific exonuclease RecJ n=1 Tax=Ostreibacterium oceani TaxID=2654998 RepID=A0A6N7EVG8_9GAMM|nr:single-stranded-DNA-specific exonuclease RecJ [Ostreibacterium oceani]MPV85595.1 single-stranded-DNA-specific exonuclease RecJ [Ostreibacterium oceani]